MSKEIENGIDTDKLRQRFDESVNAIDAETASKITQARYHVLENRARKSLRWFFVPAGAIVTACLFVMLFMLVPKTANDSVLQEGDMDLISSSEELELYEDLEFYEWLEGYDLPS